MHDMMPKFNTSQQILWLFNLIFTVLQKIYVSISVDMVKWAVCFVLCAGFCVFFFFPTNISDFAL